MSYAPVGHVTKYYACLIACRIFSLTVKVYRRAWLVGASVVVRFARVTWRKSAALTRSNACGGNATSLIIQAGFCPRRRLRARLLFDHQPATAGVLSGDSPSFLPERRTSRTPGSLRRRIAMFSWKRCAALTVGGAVICSSIGLLVMSTRSVRGDDVNASQKQDSQQSQEANQSSAKEQQTKDITLQGSGRQASNKFYLEPGLANFEISHDGQSNLVVRLLDENGKEIDTVFNQIGPFQGDRWIPIAKAVRGLLDVAADGNWNVTIRQPQPTEGQTPPVSLQGTGYHATPFVNLKKGLNIFKMKHDGKMRFRVTLLDQYGNPVDS